MNSIRKILAISFSSAFIILTLFLSVFYYGFTKNVIFNTLSQGRQDSLSLISSKIDSMLNSAYSISNLLSTDDLIIGTLMSDDISLINIPTVRSQIDDIYSRYYQAFSEIGLSFDIICVGENGFTYSSRPGFTEAEYHHLRSYSWFTKNIGSKTTSYLITNLSMPFSQNVQSSNIAIVRNVFSGSGGYKGTFFVCVPEKTLENIYSGLIDKNNFYILNPLSVVVSSSDKATLGSIPLDFSNYRFSQSNKDYSIIKTNGKTYFSAKYISPKTDWIVFEQIPLQNVLAPIKPIIFNTLLSIGVSCLLSITIAIFVSRRITSPLIEFCNKMDRAVSNNFKPIKMSSKISEIAILTNGFNHTICEISNLLEHIHQKEQDVNNAKFKFLKAQINPHFLYNTLFSIKCTVNSHRTEQACEMISILISLLRNSISSNEATSTLLDETSYITQYVKLQNLRYENTIALKISLPEELMEKRILRFLLQPLVENAIMHSSITTSEDINLQQIFISFSQEGETLKIEICNNGSTFSQPELERLLSDSQSDAPQSSSHIGLKNIEDRIQLQYGNTYGLYIGKRPDFDTVVGVCLPLNLKGE